LMRCLVVSGDPEGRAVGPGQGKIPPGPPFSKGGKNEYRFRHCASVEARACRRLRGRSRRTTGAGSGLLKAPGGRGNLPAGAPHGR